MLTRRTGTLALTRRRGGGDCLGLTRRRGGGLFAANEAHGAGGGGGWR